MTLKEKLRGVIKFISKQPIIDEKTIKEIVKELQRALILADVNPKVVLELSRRIEERMKAEKLKGLNPKEVLTKAVYEELVDVLGGEAYTPRIDRHRILLAGIFGQGKTTTVAKLAKYYIKRGMTVGAICCDLDRPAAYDQLLQLGEQTGMKVYGSRKEKDVKKLISEGLKELSGNDIIIIDSAGRNALDKEMINELKIISKEGRPDETFLVIGADMGNTALKQAEALKEAVNLTGVIITRMDSSGKAGGALSAVSQTGVPVAFIGTGEKTEDFEAFVAEAFVSRMLGFGDLNALMEKVKDLSKEQEAKSAEEILEGKFNLRIFYDQLKAARKLGPMQKVLEMVGMIDIPKDMVQTSEEKLRVFSYIMDSMTREELEDPKTIDSTRISRISKGSGRTPSEVKELLKQYKTTERMLRKMKGGKMKRLMKMGKMGKLPFKMMM